MLSDPATPADTELAAFRERDDAVLPLAVDIRPAVPGDADVIARLFAARNRVDLDDVLPRTREELAGIAAGDSGRLCLVAVLDGEIVGYGRARHMDHEADPEARGVPIGWYLTGVVVSPERRRRGVGLALTRKRLEDLAVRGAPAVWFVANAQNRVSIALHARLGFEEVTRDFALPGVTFRGGVGILFRKALATEGGAPTVCRLPSSPPPRD